jgi:hypothetical protein
MFAAARSLMLYLAGALLGMFTLWLAWPAAQASLLYLPVERALQAYWRGAELPAERLTDMQRRASAALAVQEHPRFHDGLSLAYYIRAGDADQPLYAQREAYEMSVAEARRSLALAPVQPDLWLRIAQVENWLSFSPENPVDAFKMSVLTSRVEPVLLVPRLELGFSRLGALDDEGLDLLRDQSMLAWQLARGDFLRAVRWGRLDRSGIVFLMAQTHPDVVAELEEALGPVR